MKCSEAIEIFELAAPKAVVINDFFTKERLLIKYRFLLGYKTTIIFFKIEVLEKQKKLNDLQPIMKYSVLSSTHKYMKTLTKLLPALLLALCCGQSFANPNPVSKKNLYDVTDRHLSGFYAVNLAGPFDLYITHGATESVKVVAPAGVVIRVITEVNDGVLKVYTKHESWNWGNWWGSHKKIKVYVAFKNLNSINISGSGDVYFKDGIKTSALKLSISGSGDMLGRVDVRTLESSIYGSGDMKLSGTAENSTVRVVGSGDFTARNLVTVNSEVRVSGSGDAEINASEKIDAALAGSGDVHYTGTAKNISSSKSGSGDISRF